MPLWLVEARWLLAVACLAGLGLCLLAVACLAGLRLLVESRAARWFMALPPWARCLVLCLGCVFVAWAGDKPEQEVVRGIKLESVDVTSTDATLRYHVEDAASGNAVTVTNRTAWIYKKSVDGTWRLVMEVGASTGAEFITTVSGFFPGEDLDWKVIMSGEDGEAEP